MISQKITTGKIYGKTVANKLKEKLTLLHENHFITQIKQSTKPHLYSLIKTDQMQEKVICHKINNINIDRQSPSSEYQLTCSQ